MSSTFTDNFLILPLVLQLIENIDNNCDKSDLLTEISKKFQNCNQICDEEEHFNIEEKETLIEEYSTKLQKKK